MCTGRWFALLAAAALAAPALSAEVTVVSGVGGPEGPLFVDGALYYVGWVSNTLSKWDGKKAVVLNDAKGCGHNGLALTRHGTFLLACTEAHGAILELTLAGEELRRWETDRDGKPFEGGINDIVVTDADGAYATVFGPWVEKPTLVIGKIVHLAPGAKDWIVVADDLDYANGIALSKDQKTLYVAETVGNSIKSFKIAADGTLSARTNFAQLNVLVKNRVDSWWLGPDSMKVDSHGDLYVAQWSGAKILKLSPEGKLLHVFDIAAGAGTTNLAFGPGEKELYVTVVKDPDDEKAVGSIVRIPNVAR
jgi:gluconolactonase